MQFPRTKLERVLRECYESPHSAFYRDRLPDVSSLLPLSATSWDCIPFLSRREVNATPFWERTFQDPTCVPVIRHTYGTSGNRILVTPRTSHGDYTDPYVTEGMERLMCFFASAHNECPREHGIDMQVFFGDVGNLAMSAEIAARARVDSISIPPYSALNFAPLLDARGAIGNIHTVMLIGERCSILQLERIQKLYPRARVYSVFASSETREAVALPCVHDRVQQGRPLVLEAVPEMYCEIIHPNTETLVEDNDVCGELVITTLIPDIPLPLIRYRTGDVARYVKRSCGCEKRQRGFEVLGRSSVFPVRMAKGELTIEAVEEALIAVRAPDTQEYFEAHYTEEVYHERVLPRVQIVLVSPGKQDTEALARAVAQHLMVFPNYTYAQGVSEGIYLPLEISFISAPPPGPSGKQRPSIVVRHVPDTQSEQVQHISVPYSRMS